MVLEPGGYADKLGNRYEGRWVVRQLLRLLLEEIQSVTIEAVGDDEHGVDLWIGHHDGTREAQQCKVGNGRAPQWSIADLSRRGILTYMRLQLERSPLHRYTFVTGVPVDLDELVRSARDSQGDPFVFFDTQIAHSPKPKQDAFFAFGRYLTLDFTKPRDIATAYDLLRRTETHLFVDDANSKTDVLLVARMVASGDPAAVIAVLADFADDHLRAPIHSDTLRAHLACMGFHPRDLAHDTRIAPAIDELITQFEGSIPLIDGHPIPRAETEQLLTALQHPEGSGVIVLHGAAGQGKSGTLFLLTRRLKEQGIPYLPIRLDRKTPRQNSEQFGHSLGLPDSPVICLQAMAGDRPAVLILDQLDALRWTSIHAADALDVCQQLVREVERCRLHEGKSLCMIIACRSFDFENDPAITAWLSSRRDRAIRMSDLSDETVQQVIEAHQIDYTAISRKQREILRSPQSLQIWTQLRPGADAPFCDFQTRSQLMDIFWHATYAKLEHQGIATKDVHKAITALIDYMETHEQLTAPVRLLDEVPTIANALQSQGILQLSQAKALSFTHQSHYDFHIARRLINQLDEDNASIHSWIIAGYQSLFKREQLRLLLSLMLDEDGDRFLELTQHLLDDDRIDFHLKHLVLSIVGQIEQPGPKVIALALALFQSIYWREHALDGIFMGHPPFLLMLMQCGAIDAMLNSDDLYEVEWALTLLRSIVQTHGDAVASLIEPYLDRGPEWLQRVQALLFYHRGKDDSERIFHLRLRLAQLGDPGHLLDWAEMMARYPVRAIQLLQTILATIEATDVQDLAMSRSLRKLDAFLELQEGHREAFNIFVRKHARNVWDALVPNIERITLQGVDPLSFYDHYWDSINFTGGFERDQHIFYRIVVPMVCEAGNILAASAADTFWTNTSSLRACPSIVIQRMLIEVYTALPPQYADHTLQWLLSDTRRFAVGSGVNEPEWAPAARLIIALSPHCTKAIYDVLQQAILRYHAPDEKESAKLCLQYAREGDFSPRLAWFGQAQYFLLPALDPTRRSQYANALYQILERKFSGCNTQSFLRMPGISGGWIGSKIRDPKTLSDKEWIRIIRDENIPRMSNKHQQVKPGFAVEASIEQFSRSLFTVAQGCPERFARLLLRFPSSVHPAYVAAVVSGLYGDRHKEAADNWTAVSGEYINAIAQFLETYPHAENLDVAISFCRLIESRADEQYTDGVLARLQQYAVSHPDPAPDRKMSSHTASGEPARSIVEDQGFLSRNCVRAVAAYALGKLFEHQLSRMDGAHQCISTVIQDHHPAVRLAACAMCVPMLNIDVTQAVSWFVTACTHDISIAAGQIGRLFFNNALPTHVAQLSPLITRLVSHADDAVAEFGASEVAGRWVLYGLFTDDVQSLLTSQRVAHRLGIAEIAEELMSVEEYRNRSLYLITVLMNDPEERVREKVTWILLHKDLELFQGMPKVLQDYCASQAFADNPDRLLAKLAEYPGSLVSFTDVLIMACNAFVHKVSETAHAHSAVSIHDATLLSKLVIRLYDQSDALDTRRRCIEVLNLLLKHRLGNARALVEAIGS